MQKVCFLFLAFVALSLAGAPRQQHKYNSQNVRPCFLNDYHCIGDNLAANSKCNNKQITGSVPSKHYVPVFQFEAPYFNASYIDTNIIIQNLDKCFCSEFFFNRKSDSGVLAFDCPGVVIASNRTLIQHHSLREDTVYSFFNTWEYPLIRLTSHFKRADQLDLCTSFVFTDIAAMPKYIVSPNDKPTSQFLSTDLSYVPIYERESGFYKGPPMFRFILNNRICNFGC